ncbi:Ankyrin-2-like 6, partial [Homarus americanus]
PEETDLAPSHPQILRPSGSNNYSVALQKRAGRPGVLILFRIVMVADVENQKTQFVTAMELQSLGNDQAARQTTSIQVLLDANPPKDVLDAPDHDGRTPLLVAVSEAQAEVVEKLLNAGAHINARNNNGQTALHILASAISEGVRNFKDEEILDKITDLLLDKKYKIDLEPHDPLEDLTPLGIAASRLPQGDGAPRRGGLIKFCKKMVNAGASLQETGGDGTIEEILQSKRALPSILVGGDPCPAPKRPAASEFLDMVLKRSDIQNIRAFLQKESAEDARAIVSGRLGKQTLLFYAVDRSNNSLVKTLVDFGANAWAPEITHELPIHRAADLGHLPIFNRIIDHMKGDNDSVDLREYSVSIVQKLMENGKKHKVTSDISHIDCLRRLMQDDVLLSVNQEWMGKTVLHVAASFKNQEAMSKFLCKGSFLGARQIIAGKSKTQGNILDSLLPATLEQAMDGCITHQPAEGERENVLDEDYILKLNFHFLLPPVNDDIKK